MKLHAKSLIQRLVAKLPDRWANEVYYLMQRRWGRLQKIDPLPYLRQSVRLVCLSRDYWPAEGPKIIEVGTSRTLNIPFGLWLAGAGSITTFDLNCYLRPELIAESLSGMRQQEEAIRDMFVRSEVAMRQGRYASLLACRTAAEAMTLTGINYVSPADATATKFKAECADLHVSVNTLDHVPVPVLADLPREASRAYREAFPVKMFEYMAAGLPGIASNFPLWCELLDQGTFGLLVDPTDPARIAGAIRYLLDHPAEAAALGKRGQAAALTRYNWAEEKNILLAAYAKLLDPKAARYTKNLSCKTQ